MRTTTCAEARPRSPLRKARSKPCRRNLCCSNGKSPIPPIPPKLPAPVRHLIFHRRQRVGVVLHVQRVGVGAAPLECVCHVAQRLGRQRHLALRGRRAMAAECRLAVALHSPALVVAGAPAVLAAAARHWLRRGHSRSFAQLPDAPLQESKCVLGQQARAPSARLASKRAHRVALHLPTTARNCRGTCMQSGHNTLPHGTAVLEYAVLQNAWARKTTCSRRTGARFGAHDLFEPRYMGTLPYGSTKQWYCNKRRPMISRLPLLPYSLCAWYIHTCVPYDSRVRITRLSSYVTVPPWYVCVRTCTAP